MKNETMMREAPMRIVLLKMCVPSIVIMLVVVVYNMTDIFFIGKTGVPAQVAAVALCGPLFSVLQGIGTLLGAGGSTALGIALGKGEQDKTKAITSFCFYATLAVGLLLMATGLFYSEAIARLLGADAETFGYAAGYARILLMGAPFILISNVFANIVRADGSMKVSMIANGLGTLVNVALDPLFILTMGMGVEGAAIATVLGNAMSCSYLLWYTARKQSFTSLRLNDLSLKPDISWRVISLGLPMAVSTMLMSFSSVFSNNLFMAHGNIAMAAQGVVSKVGMLIVMVIMGICMGVQPAISYNYGARNHGRMYEIIKKTAWLCVVIGTLLSFICYRFQDQFIAVFINDAAVVEYGKRMILASLVIGPFCGFYQLCTVFLQGTGKVPYALTLSALRQGIFLIPILYLCNHFAGLFGLIYAGVIADALSIVVGIILCMRWKRQIDAGASK